MNKLLNTNIQNTNEAQNEREAAVRAKFEIYIFSKFTPTIYIKFLKNVELNSLLSLQKFLFI